MTKFTTGGVLLATLMLSGCLTQSQADAKMINGCKAAVAMKIEPKTIKEFSASQAGDNGDKQGPRAISLTFAENGDTGDNIHNAACLFSQQWGTAKLSHTAVLELLTIDNAMIGKKNGDMVGSVEDFLKYTDAANTAMHQ